MVPSMKKLTMRFVRDFLAGKKQLLKAAEVQQVNVPLFPELAVSKIFPHLKQKEDFMAYLDFYSDSRELPERWYFYNVLSSLAPEYLNGLIQR